MSSNAWRNARLSWRHFSRPYPIGLAIGLAVLGALLEFVLLRGWLAAFSLAGHPGFPANDQDGLPWLLGNGSHAINHFLLLLAFAFGPYLAALALASLVEGRAGLVVALLGSLMLSATMLLSFPAGAMDIFHNIMDGRLLWVYHLNPMTSAPSAISGDPLYGYLHYWRTFRSSYGPLWFLLTAPSTLAGGSGLLRNILAYKALPFVFELVSVALIAKIARRIAPRQATAAVVCFGWNPLVLWETSANGHNDVVMMAFALLAVLLLLTRRWPLAFPALACSVLIKYASLVLLPIFVLWVLRRRGRSASAPLALSVAAMVVIIVIAYVPFWRGMHTLDPLRSQANLVIFSPAGALLGTWDELSDTRYVLGVRAVLTAAFVVLYGVSLLRLRPTPASLVRAGAEAMFLVLVLLAWWFWPWYVLWGLALAALLPMSSHARLFILFSATAMLGYISFAWGFAIWNWTTPYAAAIGTPLLVFSAPVLYATLHVLGPTTDGD